MIKNYWLKFLIIVPLLFLASCSEIIDNIDRQKEQENYVSPYMGKWIGTFTGEVSGDLILNVSKSGSIEVTRIVNTNVEEVYYTSLQGAGSAAISPSASPKGFVLTGSLETKSGTWKQQYWSGSWSVTKQP
ncbi:hypothetical protein HHL23_10910 [Chryseobacterium sp. RP-3-3]|uniref:Uncharacterized protein n=1 Tax=Chryseobacterium antibioticum TaxID=2728847 RepID=A0A7Y0AMZ3_9FLAO|nr:hypothetical protein [Chryseobacterium antibioticum]NML70308.1 hypothetical protein [Chryseobacterium antibioticum]